MSELSKLIYEFQAISTKILNKPFIKLGKPIIKFIQRNKHENVSRKMHTKEKKKKRTRELAIMRYIVKLPSLKFVVLAHDQKSRPVKQNRKLRNGFKYIWKLSV